MGYIRKSLREWFVAGLVGLALGLVIGSSATTMHELVTYEEPTPKPVPMQTEEVVMPEAPLSAADLYLEAPRFVGLEKYSEYEIEMLTRVTYAEAGNQSEYGQRLVVDTILNRVDSERFAGDDILSILTAKNQFDCVTTGAIYCYPEWDSIRWLVIEELCNRTNSDVIAFRTNRYHSWATPAFKEGDHYFSI